MSALRRDGQPVFLISQPRSGSTLLQRILAGHPDIATAAEPWLMLHALSGAPFDSPRTPALAAAARAFLEATGSEEVLVNGLRQAYLAVYAQAAQGRALFLDKTPRYYSIIPALHRLFPQARFILLTRNPLAVLVSLVHAWIGENWASLADYRQDLLEAPERLLEGRKLLGPAAIWVRYEDLVSRPEEQVAGVCRHLGIPFEQRIIEYGRVPQPDWKLGARGVRDHALPVATGRDGWKSSLTDPQRWRLMQDYLNALGADCVTALGYDFDALQAEVAAARPAGSRVVWTMSLRSLLEGEPAVQHRCASICMRFRRALQRHGILGIPQAAARRLWAGWRGQRVSEILSPPVL